MHSSEGLTAVRVENMGCLALDGLIGGKVAFDARVNSVLKSALPNQLRLQLRLREILLQAVIDANVITEAVWDEAHKLTPESIIRVNGHVQPILDNAENSGNNAYTVHVTGLDVIAQASPDLPSFHNKEASAAGLEERLSNRIMDVRHGASGAIFKLHSGMCQLLVEFLCSNGFHWVHTPRIITSPIAGDNDYFHLPYFVQDAWLAQSSQHHKQMALSMDMQCLFEIGPVFRAEVKSSKSARHLTEFTVLDVAMVFQDNYHEVAELIECMLVFVFRGLQERKRFKPLLEAVEKLYPSKRILREELGHETNDGKNLTEHEEAALGRHFRESPHLGSTNVFTIDQYPASMRQLNSLANPDALGVSNTWDTIVGGREICSDSQRINEHDELCEAMRADVCGPPLDPEADKWQPYLTAFKAGMPRHGGCGLGVNRLWQSFLRLDDVREAHLFPHDVNRLRPWWSS